MIRKGDTKDANDSTSDDKITQEKWFRSSQPEWFPCKAKKL